MNTPNDTAKLQHDLHELEQRIPKDKSVITLEEHHIADIDRKMNEVKHKIAEEEAKLKKMEEEKTHSAEHIATAKQDMAVIQNQMKSVQMAFQKAGFAVKR